MSKSIEDPNLTTLNKTISIGEDEFGDFNLEERGSNNFISPSQLSPASLITLNTPPFDPSSANSDYQKTIISPLVSPILKPIDNMKSPLRNSFRLSGGKFQLPPSIKEIEARKIVAGDFFDREILLKREKQSGYQIYKFDSLVKGADYYTPSGNKINRVDDTIVINETERVSFNRDTKTSSENKLDDPNNFINLNEAGELRLQNIPKYSSRKSVNANIMALAASEIISDSQEEETSEWLFSPNPSANKRNRFTTEIAQEDGDAFFITSPLDFPNDDPFIEEKCDNDSEENDKIKDKTVIKLEEAAKPINKIDKASKINDSSKLKDKSKPKQTFQEEYKPQFFNPPDDIKFKEITDKKQMNQHKLNNTQPKNISKHYNVTKSISELKPINEATTKQPTKKQKVEYEVPSNLPEIEIEINEEYFEKEEDGTENDLTEESIQSQTSSKQGGKQDTNEWKLMKWRKQRQSNRLSKTFIKKPNVFDKEYESIVVARDIVTDIISSSVDVSKKHRVNPSANSDKIALFGKTKGVPPSVAEDILQQTSFGNRTSKALVAVDVNIYLSDQSSTPVYTELSVPCFMELFKVTNENSILLYYSTFVGGNGEMRLPSCLFQLNEDNSNSPLKKLFYYDINVYIQGGDFLCKIVNKARFAWKHTDTLYLDVNRDETNTKHLPITNSFKMPLHSVFSSLFSFNGMELEMSNNVKPYHESGYVDKSTHPNVLSRDGDNIVAVNVDSPIVRANSTPLILNPVATTIRVEPIKAKETNKKKQKSKRCCIM
ncbi:hypothetical protein ABK040_010014 [Willaertia magna]